MDSIASNKQQSMKMMAMPELKPVSAFRRLLPQVRDTHLCISIIRENH